MNSLKVFLTPLSLSRIAFEAFQWALTLARYAVSPLPLVLSKQSTEPQPPNSSRRPSLCSLSTQTSMGLEVPPIHTPRNTEMTQDQYKSQVGNSTSELSELMGHKAAPCCPSTPALPSLRTPRPLPDSLVVHDEITSPRRDDEATVLCALPPPTPSTTSTGRGRSGGVSKWLKKHCKRTSRVEEAAVQFFDVVEEELLKKTRELRQKEDIISLLNNNVQELEREVEMQNQKIIELQVRVVSGQSEEKSPMHRPSPCFLRPFHPECESSNSSKVACVTEASDAIGSAIVCLVFGRRHFLLPYVLLAVGTKAGVVYVYRCYLDVPKSDCGIKGDIKSRHATMASLHVTLEGHQAAVSSLAFLQNDEKILTASLDRTLRIWRLDGKTTHMFTESCGFFAAIPHSLLPHTSVVLNTRGLLRLVDFKSGKVMQKVKVETELRAISFDDTGMHCFAGCKKGELHVLEVDRETGLLHPTRVFGVSQAAITCITFVAPRGPKDVSYILVNSNDSSVAIVECLIGESQCVETLTVKRRVAVDHRRLPLKSCYSPLDSGWLVSGSEDNAVYVYPMNGEEGDVPTKLEHHQAPVICVGVDPTCSILASGDANGCILFWKRDTTDETAIV